MTDIKITKEWLETKNACSDGKQWVLDNAPDLEGVELVDRLIAANKLNWANWLIVRIMTYEQYVGYAIFSAEQVLHICEKRSPNNALPRAAIEAAKKCLANPTKENKDSAFAAASAASAAYAAAHAVYAAAFAADSAFAAASAAYAAAHAADSAYFAADSAAAKRNMQLEILTYGLELLRCPTWIS